jgi:hypothetical protein
MLKKIGIAAAAALVAFLAAPSGSVAATKGKKVTPQYEEYLGGGRKCHGGFAECTQTDIPPLQSNYRSTHKKQVKPGS